MVHQWQPRFSVGQRIVHKGQPPREIESVVIDENKPTGIYNFVGGGSDSIRFVDNGYENIKYPKLNFVRAELFIGGKKRKTHRNSKRRKLNRRKSNRRR
jgi:hypothetical protein